LHKEKSLGHCRQNELNVSGGCLSKYNDKYDANTQFKVCSRCTGSYVEAQVASEIDTIHVAQDHNEWFY
jgi:hypothetical protein